MESFSTKEKIMKTSILLFSEKGYDNISMRDIAAAVGIKAASIYNHFPSKHDILKSIYSFYTEQLVLAAPPLEDLLAMVETSHPYKVFMEMNIRFTPGIHELMQGALSIASKGMKGHDDGDAEQFLYEVLFDFSMKYYIPLLSRMQDLNKIEPINVETFAFIITYYKFSAAVLNSTKMRIGWETYISGLEMLNSLIKPVEKETCSSAGETPLS